MTELSFKGPRERLLQKGSQALSDLELLAIILRTGSAAQASQTGLRVLSLAKQLLEHFGNLRQVLLASPEQLKQLPGIGDSKVATLLAVKEITVRLSSGSFLLLEKISDCQAAYRLFHEIAYEDQEVLKAAFLTNQNQLIRKQEIFRGTVNGSLAAPREIIREALRANASKFIIAHNHPSHLPEPSAEDIAFTNQLQRAARVVGIPLIDHLIVCEAGKFFSFTQAGLL